VTAPLAEEDEAPFVSPLANLENLVLMINDQFEGKPAMPLPSPSDEKTTTPAIAAPKRKRGSVTAPLSPEMKTEQEPASEPATTGPARRTSKRRR